MGVAQIVITAATPLVEAPEEELGAEDSRAEADQHGAQQQGAPHRPAEEPLAEIEEEADPESIRSECEGEALFLEDEDRQPPPPPAPEGPRDMRAAEEGRPMRVEMPPTSIGPDEGGSPKSPISPCEGPPDLDPENLKTLERIKESNA